MNRPSRKVYTVIDLEYLNKNLGGFSEERSDTKKGISALLFCNHINHMIRKNGAFAIPVDFLRLYVGLSRETFQRVNDKYKFYNIVDHTKFGISREMIPTDRTKALVEGLLGQGRPQKVFVCENVKNKQRYRKVQGKIEVDLQGYTVRNYQQDLYYDYTKTVKGLYKKHSIELADLDVYNVVEQLESVGYFFPQSALLSENSIIEWIIDNYNIYRRSNVLRKNKGVDYSYLVKSKEFFYTEEWKLLRVDVFQKYGRKCLRCGKSQNLHIDHILPRSKYPELELDFDNLQVLCNSCNDKKSNIYYWDYRPIPNTEKLRLLNKIGLNDITLTEPETEGV